MTTVDSDLDAIRTRALATCDRAEAALDDYIRRLVDAAPELSESQRVRLRILIGERE